MAKKKDGKRGKKRARRGGAGRAGLPAGAGNPAGADGVAEIITDWTPTRLANYVKLMVNQGDTLTISLEDGDIVVRVG